MRSRLPTVVVATVCLALGVSVSADASGWAVVKKGPTIDPGGVAFVGSIVRRPAAIGIRATTSVQEHVALTVVTSCRRGSTIRVGRERVGGRAPFTRRIRLPLAGASHCAVSATGTSAAGTLQLDLLRST